VPLGLGGCQAARFHNAKERFAYSEYENSKNLEEVVILTEAERNMLRLKQAIAPDKAGNCARYRRQPRGRLLPLVDGLEALE
jgi:hypothetical protein